MTFQQSLDLAEIEADLAHEKFLEAFERDDYSEVIDRLNNEATMARHQGRCDVAEPCPVRSAVLGAGLAQGQGAGHAPSGCDGVNQGGNCSGQGCYTGL